MKKAIYTVITDGYDTLKVPRNGSKCYDFICFTNDISLSSSFWKIIYINKQSRHLQREIKIKAHEYLPDYDFTIYVDGSAVIKRDLSQLEMLIGKSDILFVKHHKRTCLYDEEKAIHEFRKDIPLITNPQIEKYRSEGMPVQFGMYQTCLIARRKTKEVEAFCNLWWHEVENHSHRDQLSVMYAQWKTGIQPVVIGHMQMVHLLSIQAHNFNYRPPLQTKELRVFYSTPARADKNIGRAYNEFMSTVPDGSWVCLRDGDTMFTTPDWPKHIEDIISENGNKYDVIGCMTNRLKSEHQLIEGMFDEESITKHLDIASSIRSNEVVAADSVAGLCLIFNKDVWEKVKFKEESITFDTEFSKSVRRNGFKIGVAKGLYLIHLYRWGQENPCKYVKHLL